MKKMRLYAEVMANAATAFGERTTARHSKRRGPNETTKGCGAAVRRITVLRPDDPDQLLIGQAVQQIDLHAKAEDSFTVHGAS
ncbi:hypothetical protein QYH69_24200 [Paraburkholderia sp. SARCC-3016]|uniref:hypothetical protein n=1 Tax=Paraburkholderia sp. SARCC-3016 TaxID=3058611 RepID=UPI002807D874|nr:hypothetical protein [Paraburkholderia sp. SARCC-3016]MDQ7980344.1 hypothetical protein [Paraburkholderia sp. SARCC-3016]